MRGLQPPRDVQWPRSCLQRAGSSCNMICFSASAADSAVNYRFDGKTFKRMGSTAAPPLHKVRCTAASASQRAQPSSRKHLGRGAISHSNGTGKAQGKCVMPKPPARGIVHFGARPKPALKPGNGLMQQHPQDHRRWCIPPLLRCCQEDAGFQRGIDHISDNERRVATHPAERAIPAAPAFPVRGV